MKKLQRTMNFRHNGWTLATVALLMWQVERVLSFILSPSVRSARAESAIRTESAFAYIVPVAASALLIAVPILIIVGAFTAIGIAWMRYGKAAMSADISVSPMQTDADVIDIPHKVLPLPSGQTSLSDLTIGYGESGVPIKASLHDLMHTLCVGASGFGKSTWVRSLLYQIARCKEAIQVVAIDCYGSEFNCMRDWDKLMWPIARTHEDAVGTLTALRQEIVRRQELFEHFPLASKLDEYNELADGEQLPPILCVVEEGTAMLNEADIGDNLRSIAQTARQYGIYITILGQSANYKVMETQTRDQFPTRIVFRVPPSSSKAILDDRCASNLSVPGVAYAQLIGRPLQKIQAPFVTREQFYAALTTGNTTTTAQVVEMGNVGEGDSRTDEIRKLYASGVSKTAIQRKLFGYSGGAAYDAVQTALSSITTTDSVCLEV